MSDFIVEIIESEDNVIEIINTEKLLASDFPDFYHTKIIDFNTAVSGLLPSGISSISIEDVQDIIGLSGIIGGTGINISYNDITGFTTINTSGLTLGTTPLNLGGLYLSLSGLTMISGISINNPTVLVNCRIDGGTP